MFTGIVEEAGIVKSVLPGEIAVSASRVLEDADVGNSIAVNGVCLTITSLDDVSFSVNVMPETLRRTNLGTLRLGRRVNLERALKLGGRLGGHLVQGHVDATGKVLSMTPEGKAIITRYAAPPEVMHYVVKRGFIAVDGVSLTVIERDATSLTVSLVTLTQKDTTLGAKQRGESVNLEVDIIAKYIEQLNGGSPPGITVDFLAQHGFLSQIS